MIIINPGAGPVEEHNLDDATASIEELCKQLKPDFKEEITWELENEEDNNGRYEFYVTTPLKTHEVSMPGLPPDKMQLGPFRSPRLYVDGSSWLWEFALNMISNPDDE